MTERVCGACGEEAVPGVQFCTSCGAYLGWSESGPAPAPTTDAPRPSAPVPSAPTGPPPPGAAPFGPAPTAPASGTPIWAPAPTQVVESAPPAPGPRCPRCDTVNDIGRRFCRRCGQYIGEPTGRAGAAVPVRRVPWWRRWWRRRPDSERRARTAYRRSLPLWVRLRRWLVALAVIVLAGAYLHFIGRDPLSWARQRLYALRGTVVAVQDVTATSAPATGDPGNKHAAAAVDGDATTAWATAFVPDAGRQAGTCVRPAGQTALVLTVRKEVTVRAVNVQAGLPDSQNRLAYWRPRVLDLQFSDGSCRSITVKDDPNWQLVRFDPVRTTAVTITLVQAYPPSGGSTSKQAAITDVQLMQRPH